ncbi:MAG: hypothetical protein BroJett007_05210 [Chloroflexota bacterium]|nr:MAG: hypothetical protein BroJett007_05210 [Chloroflexota bacterium]
MRSPNDSIAADIAETRSSSTPTGSDDAMLNPSTLMTAEASMPGPAACRSRKRSTINSVRDFAIGRSLPFSRKFRSCVSGIDNAHIVAEIRRRAKTIEAVYWG